MRLFLSVLLCSSLWAEWVMFADKKDTYLYNNQTGEIYIRHHKGGKNYEDVFVKMPHGISSDDLSTPKVEEDLRLKSLKKSQELLDDALKGAF